MQELINKDVEIMVALSSYTVSGGSIPEKHSGRLLYVNDDFCKLQLTKSKKNILIAIKFIISIKEMG